VNLVDVSLQFPTIVWTIALGIALVYWAFVLIGALDIDLLGGGHDVDLGGMHAGGHDVGGGHDAGHDGGHDGDGDGSAGGLWHALGLGHVPLTISVSFIILVSWVTSLLGSYYVLDPERGSALRWLIVPAALLIALPLAALLVRPLAPVFEIKEGKSNADYVGHVCTVTSNAVDDTFGYANIEDGSSVVQIAVRCDPARKLARGDRALVIEFDPERRLFVVEPSKDVGA
jgi:hypothetical protein